MRKLPLAVVDRDASVLSGASAASPSSQLSPTCPPQPRPRIFTLEFLKVRLDDRAVELPADAAEVGEDGRQAPQRRVQQLAQLVVLGVLVGFD